MSQNVITKQIQLDHPIQKVWTAISQEAEITKWFIQADFKAEVGYQYTFTHEDTKIVGEVKQVNEPTTLVYSWEIKGMEGTSLVTWTLKEKDQGTELTIEHTGIDGFGKSAPQMFESFTEGWDKVADELVKYLG